MRKYRIIIVEDDSEAGFYTKDFLEDCGFEVELFALSTDALASMKIKKYDMLLLDLNLPDFNGFEVLTNIKSSIAIPTIVISAYSNIKTKLQAFKLGALDYITKPYNLQELEARIWASMSKGVPNPESLDKETFRILNQDIFFKGEKLRLTQIESEILKALILNNNNTLSREVLASSLSKISAERSLDYHIKNIRKKIHDDGSNPQYLKTEYGIGYILSF